MSMCLRVCTSRQAAASVYIGLVGPGSTKGNGGYVSEYTSKPECVCVCKRVTP